VKKNTPLLSCRNNYLIILFVFAGLCFASCKKLDVFEKNTSIPKYEWQYNQQPSFNFTITDTTSLYYLFVVLRHTDAYRYNNIWLNVGTQFPGDTMRQQRFDLQLGNDAKGWDGAGMDDIWEIRKPLTKGPVKLNKAGNYTFSVAQIMRENPLPNIMSVGIRVEKVK
jgi:gliding motility-associated lipoprotein GldH